MLYTRLYRVALPVLLVIAGGLLWQNQHRIFGDKGRLEVVQQGNAVVFRWHHAIDVPMAKRFSEYYRQWRDKTDHFIIDLNSPGGSLREGSDVIKVISIMKQHKKVDTYVGPKAICASMCVPIYLQGQKRLAAANSAWMFHEPIAVDYFSKDEVKLSRSEREHLADGFYARYFATADINEAWRLALKKHWRGREIWKTGAALVAENSGIIQELR